MIGLRVFTLLCAALAAVSASPVATRSASPVTTVPDSPDATVSDSPDATVPASPVATVSDSPFITVPASPVATVSDSRVTTVSDSLVTTVPASPVATVSDSPVTTVPASPVATVSPSRVPAPPPPFGGDSVRVCGYIMSSHCSGPSACDNFDLNECKGLSALNLSFSIKLSFDEKTNTIIVERFTDSKCQEPHPNYTPAPSGQLDQCIGPVAKYLYFVKVYVKVSRV